MRLGATVFSPFSSSIPTLWWMRLEATVFSPFSSSIPTLWWMRLEATVFSPFSSSIPTLWWMRLEATVFSPFSSSIPTLWWMRMEAAAFPLSDNLCGGQGGWPQYLVQSAATFPLCSKITSVVDEVGSCSCQSVLQYILIYPQVTCNEWLGRSRNN